MATPTVRTVASYNTHQEHSIDFFGNELIVTVTSSPTVISRWLSNVRNSNCRPYSSHPPVVGVGVQWTPAGFHSNPPPNSFYSDQLSGSYYSDQHSGNYSDQQSGNYYDDEPQASNYYADPPPGSYYEDPSPGNYYTSPPSRSYVDPPPDTLQLCIGNRCLIIKLSHCNRIPNDLRSFLTDPQTTFVGVWNGQDARKLAQSLHRLEIGELHDIRNYVADSEGRSLRSCSFEVIVEECLGYYGVRLDPEISMSDWSVYSLFDEQILQASLDAYVCSELGVWARLWEV
ncbi:hypothetical protein AALP_AA3G134400 [Arabis alpina]|uniref:3'-5' exonuclease domain-containing protein n=1 Tax=Arabis alpina TaxID=50452 RepID=A0A087H8Z5_ARAAL|nr:hypothetical protein AALP_AA3G134400 [Arabis alpina]